MKTIGRLMVAIAMVATGCTTTTEKPKHIVKIVVLNGLSLIEQSLYEQDYKDYNYVSFEVLESIADSTKEEVNIVTYRKYKTSRGSVWLPTTELNSGQKVGMFIPKGLSD